MDHLPRSRLVTLPSSDVATVTNDVNMVHPKMKANLPSSGYLRVAPKLAEPWRSVAVGRVPRTLNLDAR